MSGIARIHGKWYDKKDVKAWDIEYKMVTKDN